MKVSKGDVMWRDGVFLTEDAAKKLAQTVEERNALRREYSDVPTHWQRFWTNAAMFTVGVGVGALLP